LLLLERGLLGHAAGYRGGVLQQQIAIVSIGIVVLVMIAADLA